jgi:GT2 family glycosyltransferase
VPGHIGVAIVTYNSADQIGRCLDSVLGDPEVASVAVRDNGSTDGTQPLLERLAGASPSVLLVGDGSNVGYGAGINEAARALGAEYLLVLNPDTEVGSGALSAMLERFGDPAVGMVGPKLVLADGSLDHGGARRAPTLRSAFLHSVPGLRRYANYVVDEPGPEVEAISGSCMLLPRALFERLGGFDTGFWMYGEDLDLCLRVRQAGFAVGWESRAAVTHHRSASTGRYRSWRVTRAFYDAHIRYYDKHLAPATGPRWQRAAVVAGIRLVGLLDGLRNVVMRELERRRPRHPAPRSRPPS